LTDTRRSPAQVETLRQTLARLGRLRWRPIVLWLEVPPRELVRRLRRRAEQEGGSDDTEEAIAAQLPIELAAPIPTRPQRCSKAWLTESPAARSTTWQANWRLSYAHPSSAGRRKATEPPGRRRSRTSSTVSPSTRGSRPIRRAACASRLCGSSQSRKRQGVRRRLRPTARRIPRADGATIVAAVIPGVTPLLGRTGGSQTIASPKSVIVCGHQGRSRRGER
jgi:hypothetical protein